MRDNEDKHHLISSDDSSSTFSSSTDNRDYNPVHHPEEKSGGGIKGWFNKHKPELHHISEDRQHIPGPVPASTSDAKGNDTTLHGALMKTEKAGKQEINEKDEGHQERGDGGVASGSGEAEREGEGERKYKYDPRKICPPGTNWTTFLKF